MPAKKTSSQPISDIALQIAGCYAAIYPAAPARSKAMKWINTSRKAIDGHRGILSDEMSDGITELVAAGVLEPSIEGRKGISAPRPKVHPRDNHPILRKHTRTWLLPYYSAGTGAQHLHTVSSARRGVTPFKQLEAQPVHHQ